MSEDTPESDAQPLAEAIGRRLKALRKKKINPATGKPYTLEQAAHEMGLTFPTLAQYEQGRRIPYPQSLDRLADFYGVTVDEILGREIQVSEDCVKVFLRHKGLAEEDVTLVMKVMKAILQARGKP